MDELHEKVKEFLCNGADASMQELARWVQERSLAGNEAQVQDFVRGALGDLGMEVKSEIINGAEIAKDKNFFSPRTEFGESPNIVGVLHGSDSNAGRSLIINGHVDVVPEGDRSQWNADPYSGKIETDASSGRQRLYGRGVTDMKGGSFAALLALRALRHAGIKLKGTVTFHSVVEEESGGAGTLWLIKQGYGKADLALIPEPSELKVFPQQQGSQWFRLTVKGVGAHGGTRYEGVSAIEKAFKVLTAVLALEKRRNESLKAENPLVAKLPIPIPINMGKIRAGEWPSSVPDEAIMEGRMGIIPGESIETARAQMEKALEGLRDEDAWFVEHPVRLEWFGARWLPGTVDLDHESLPVIKKAFRQVMGNDPEVACSPWGTDGGLLNQLAGTPAIVLGPGVTKMAHFPNEYIYTDDVLRCAEIYALTIAEWCRF